MKKYVALYTKHVTQKNKKFIDGFVLVNTTNSKVTLQDEKGNKITSCFLRGEDYDLANLNGAEFVMEGQFLVQVEDEIQSTTTVTEEKPKQKTVVHKPTFAPPLKRNQPRDVKTEIVKNEFKSASGSKQSKIKPFKPPAKINVPKGGRSATDILELLSDSPSNVKKKQSPKTIQKKSIDVPSNQKESNMHLKKQLDFEEEEDILLASITGDIGDMLEETIQKQPEIHTSKQKYGEETVSFSSRMSIEYEPQKFEKSPEKTNYRKILDDDDDGGDDLLDDLLDSIRSGKSTQKSEQKKPEIKKPMSKQEEIDDVIDFLNEELEDDYDEFEIKTPLKSVSSKKPEQSEPQHQQIKSPKKRLLVIDDDDDDEDDEYIGKTERRRYRQLNEISSPTKSTEETSNQSTSKNRGFKPPAKSFASPFKSHSPRNIENFSTSILSIVQSNVGERHTLYFPDSRVCEMFKGYGQHPKRSVRIPDQFNSVNQYKLTFLDAVYEQMNLELFSLALKFRDLYNRVTTDSSNIGDESKSDTLQPVKCRCGQQARLLTVQKAGKNRGRKFFACPKGQKGGCGFFQWADNNASNVQPIINPARREDYFRHKGIAFYSSCELIMSYTGKKKKSQKTAPQRQWFLKVENKEKGSPYAIDDLWIISTSSTFNKADGNVFLARSVWHGPNSNGLLQITVASGKPRVLSSSDTQEVYAIRGPNFSTEFEIIDNLKDLDGIKLPLLYQLLGTKQDPKQLAKGVQMQITKSGGLCRPSDSEAHKMPSFDIGLSQEEIKRVADEHVKKYKLNEDQSKVLYQCSQWFNSDSKDRGQPIMLVHGTFGAGKSFMLTVLVKFFCALLDSVGNTDIRILISSMTNVAVDTILQGLLNLEFTNFARVGSTKKIAKTILPYMIRDDKTKREIIKEYKQMLKEAMDPAESMAVKQAIEELETGVADERRDNLKKVRVVGVTCAASTFKILEGSKFSILILDESSQCLEPLALLPLSRFSCQKLIAVGDPNQLPPTLTGSKELVEDERSIQKTLFIRLANVGFTPVLLRTQYRCHPKISELANKMFYDNTLKDGIKSADRSALIPNAPPVMVIDVPHGKEEYVGTGSLYNDAEISAVVNLVKILLNSGFPADELGVITLYRTQSFKIFLKLKQLGLAKIKVSTVDAFQGGEREIIILSTCKTENLAFLECKKRLNVAITRARRHLIIVGKKSALSQSPLWKIILDQAKSMWNGCFPDSILQNVTDLSFLEPPPQDEKTESSPVTDSPLKRKREDTSSPDEKASKMKRNETRKIVYDDDDEEVKLDRVRILDDDDEEMEEVQSEKRDQMNEETIGKAVEDDVK